MMTIGLGNHRGAQNIHSCGIYGLETLIPEMGKLIIGCIPIAFGVALLENAFHETAEIHAIEADTEKKLLREAKDLMASLPSNKIDFLIVNEMGENISGTGMDTNIIGRIYVRGEVEPRKPDISFIGVLDLTEEAHGNAIGVGYADLTTRRLVNKIKIHDTYTNVITSVFPQLAKIPITLETDRELMDVAMKFVEPKTSDEARFVRVKNTLELQKVEVSTALWEELKKDTERFEAISEPYEMTFDKKVNLL